MMAAKSMWLRAAWTPKRGASATALVEPFDVPTVGRIGILLDPQGAVFGVYMPAGEESPAGEPGLGDVAWYELATSDHEAALGFY